MCVCVRARVCGGGESKVQSMPFESIFLRATHSSVLNCGMCMWIAFTLLPKCPPAFSITTSCSLLTTRKMHQTLNMTSQIAKFMGPIWGPPGSCWPQTGPISAPWTGMYTHISSNHSNQVTSRVSINLCKAISQQLFTVLNHFIGTDFFHDATDQSHYNDVTMSAMASQITSVSIICSNVCSDADQRKHQSSASLALCAGNSPVTGEFPAQRASYNAENVSVWWRHHGAQ